ncbi:hypothetical protein NCS57_00846400 [Fusarium keratoplasticum]|uniref:Uncharacterized protein n=1 Tax=Fusarium keratoplasticum TaxID=1328300 RepID=A0ACC0QUB0_9HYPO|nr:hypothetical protein NCS57_00846400 [Fusarium keratoplasticum]KAI8666222.1 hypothetical protein NCS57_00846400 [Fusarium keratoplasticum]
MCFPSPRHGRYKNLARETPRQCNSPPTPSSPSTSFLLPWTSTNLNYASPCKERRLVAKNYPPASNALNQAAIVTDRKSRPGSVLQHQELPDPDSPRRALTDQRIARLFHNYTADVSQWYDLSDSTGAFGILVPGIALDEPLLFSAIIALSAMHICKTSANNFRKVAEFYHHRCVQRLIELDQGDELITQGVALAATCLLRSYEILDGDIDPNMHLRGAYSMAPLHDVLSGNLQPGLTGAGFWNYLREDITFSLFEKCPLKMDLTTTPLLINHHSAQDYLNSITLILGKVINTTFGRNITGSEWFATVEMLSRWRAACPERTQHFSREKAQPGTINLFPAVWFLQPCHAATTHYYLVALTILCFYANPQNLEDLGKLDLAGIEVESKDQLLEAFAVEICGIAFTTKVPSVLVNAFGPIAYCARFINAEPVRQELARQLLACKSSIGWPVERLINDLKSFWGAEETN